MAECDLFQDLSGVQMSEIAQLSEPHSIQPDEMVLREGGATRYLYVIIKGRGIAQLETNRGWLSLGLVGPGDTAGWSALAGGQVYPASVKALTEMQVRRIDSKALTVLMKLDSNMGYGIHSRLSELFCRQYQAALEAFRTMA